MSPPRRRLTPQTSCFTRRVGRAGARKRLTLTKPTPGFASLGAWSRSSQRRRCRLGRRAVRARVSPAVGGRLGRRRSSLLRRRRRPRPLQVCGAGAPRRERRAPIRIVGVPVCNSRGTMTRAAPHSAPKWAVRSAAARAAQRGGRKRSSSARAGGRTIRTLRSTKVGQGLQQGARGRRGRVSSTGRSRAVPVAPARRRKLPAAPGRWRASPGSVWR